MDLASNEIADIGRAAVHDAKATPNVGWYVGEVLTRSLHRRFFLDIHNIFHQFIYIHDSFDFQKLPPEQTRILLHDRAKKLLVITGVFRLAQAYRAFKKEAPTLPYYIEHGRSLYQACAESLSGFKYRSHRPGKRPPVCLDAVSVFDELANSFGVVSDAIWHRISRTSLGPSTSEDLEALAFNRDTGPYFLPTILR